MARRFAALVLALVFVSGAAPGASGQSPEHRRVRAALPGFENNLTPFTITFGSLPNTHDFVMLVYDTLFWSQVKEDPEPWLAEAATPSGDFTNWTVTLRDGVVWHDGRPLTAEDVKFSFDYYLQAPGASGRYAHHVSDVPPFDRAEVLDPRTVRLFFRAPAPQFKVLPGGDLPIIPKHIWESVKEPTKFTSALPVGSGPFKVVEIVPDQLYRLEANEAYFKGEPTVDELQLPIVKDPATAFAALRTGEVDFVARNVPPELGDEFASNPELKVVKGTKFESTQLYFNARKPRLADPRLRKAVSLAIDGQALVDTVILGRGRAGTDSFIHPDSPWALPEATHEHNPTRAADLLDSAGYTARDADGVRKAPDGSRLEFRVLVSSFEPQDIRAVQLIAQQVAPIGVRLVPEVLDPATLRERRRGPEGQIPPYDAYVSTLEAHAHVDPDGLYYFFHSPGPKGFGAAITGYGNPNLDALVERATVTALAERKPLLHDAQRILADEVPVIVFWYRDGEYAYRPAAYDGWVSDFGHGIFTKRSFLPDYAQPASGRAPAGSGDVGNGTGWLLGVVGGVVVLIALLAVTLRRRRRPDELEA